ncbi:MULTISPECIES: hypothetical protein [Cytobacillus]|nr:hypothetical protein [Cytobacillus firmus]
MDKTNLLMIGEFFESFCQDNGFLLFSDEKGLVLIAFVMQQEKEG